MDTHERTRSTARVFRPTTRVRRPGHLVLRVLDGPSPGLHELSATTIKVGRSSMADVVIQHGSVSKLHFELRVTDRGLLLRDLGSTNGTWRDERRVEALYLQPGDEFLAGECRVRVESVGDVEVEALEGEHFGELRGSSLPMRELYAQISALGPTPLDMLILGETGTGKELTARTVHELSRPRRPFIVLDCASLSSSLVEGTLFGFKRGAFTGADHDQPGIFEEAHTGTLFMDEVGELPLDLQRKLLGVLERRETSRLGEPAQPRAVDVRVIAATHRDLRQGVADGTFREDLYYRLARAVVHTPPLRERGKDVVELAQTFLSRVCQEYALAVELGEAARAMLVAHPWPGNVRELRNAVERAAHVCQHGEIGPEHLHLEGPGHARRVAPVDEDRTYAQIHAELDRRVLPHLLDRYDGNLSHMARHLDLSRDTLRKRLKAVGLYTKR